MASGKSALEQLQLKSREPWDVRPLLATAAFALSFALMVAYFFEAFSIMREGAVVERLDAQRQEVVKEYGALIESLQQKVTRALEDEQLPLMLEPLDATNKFRAEKRLRQRLPELVEVDFYEGELPELLSGNLSRFGYARASILADALNNSKSKVQLHKDKGGVDRFAFARALVNGQGRVVAYAYLLLPADMATAVVERITVSDGRLDIHQGNLGKVAFSANNAHSSSAMIVVKSDHVPDSIFLVATARTDFFRLGARFALFDFQSTTYGFVLGAIFLLLAVGAFVWRQSMLKPDSKSASFMASSMEKLRFGKKDAEPEEMMPALVAKPPPTVAAKKPVPEKKPPMPVPAAAKATLDRSIFRAYDIRGVVGKTLSGEIARLIGRAIGSLVRERGLREVVVGRDGRLSGPELSAELIQGLRESGCDVIDIGAAPTPVVYFAIYHLHTGSGVAVTGSHNPPDYNGFKVVVGGQTLAEDAIQDLYARISEGRLQPGTGGLQSMDVMGEYIARITGDVQVERPLRIVVDCGNGIAGAVAPQVLAGIGCEVLPLHCEVDGTFPSHHPDPSDPQNLQDLTMTVQRLKADFGVAFDGDGDRLGVVTAKGEIIYPDRLLMLFAMDVLNRNPGATVIYDVKCTGHLQDVILRHGGSPIMWKTGHSLIKAKMAEQDAELAGEMSGHFFFRERWYGFDDGIYAAARLCEILAATDRPPLEVFGELPSSVSTPELKIEMEEGANYRFIEKFREKSGAAFTGARLSTIDGIRADYPDGWGLVRSSNTTPSLVLRFDADNEQALLRIQEAFRAQLLAVEPQLKLPF